MAVVDFSEARHRRERAASFTALKFAMLDDAASDHRLTDLDFRLLYYLASATDRDTQIARRKQKVIAAALGVTRRAVQIGAERLSEFEYIVILTKDGGSYTNGYRIVLEKANPDSPLARKRRTRSSKKANETGEKGERSFAPTLPFNSLEIPSRRRGPSSTDVLGPASAALRQRFGDAVFVSWFSKVRLASETAGVVTLIAPTRFIRSHIEAQYSADLLRVWQSVSPTVERVVIVVEDASQAKNP
jgi:hypothetical protein